MEIAGYNEDISSEILLRLPVKSVLKFKTVSKLWLSIVSTTRFRQNHASRHTPTATPTGLFFKFHDTLDVYGLFPLNYDSYPIQPKVSRYALHANLPAENIDLPCTSSCNGLQLLTSTKRKWSPAENIDLTCISSCNGLQLLRLRKRLELNDDYTYYVYNPTTMEYKLLLNIPEHITNRQYVCASLAFYPSESLHYKVIFLWEVGDEKFQIEVYSSTTGTCKAPVTNTFVGNFDHLDTRGIFCNGAIHWLSSDATSVVYFNVHTECLNELPTPLPIAPSNTHYFGQSQGRLHFVNSHTWILNLKCSSVLDVYELKRDYSGWFLKYQVELASFVSVNELEDIANVVSIVDQGEEEEEDLILMVLSSELVEINPKNKTRKRLYVLPLPCTSPLHWSYWVSWSSWLDNHKFIPTLTCV